MKIWWKKKKVNNIKFIILFLGKEGFDPKELVCANCCEVAPIENCSKHGKDFIEFKCKFCCSIA